jgi:hypothetical protein
MRHPQFRIRARTGDEWAAQIRGAAVRPVIGPEEERSRSGGNGLVKSQDKAANTVIDINIIIVGHLNFRRTGIALGQKPTAVTEASLGAAAIGIEYENPQPITRCGSGVEANLGITYEDPPVIRAVGISIHGDAAWSNYVTASVEVVGDLGPVITATALP